MKIQITCNIVLSSVMTATNIYRDPTSSATNYKLVMTATKIYRDATPSATNYKLVVTATKINRGLALSLISD